MLDRLIAKNYQVQFEAHARAIFSVDFQEAVHELEAVLDDFTMSVPELVGGGGGETAMTQRLRRALTERGWRKRIFQIEKKINDRFSSSISHEVDHVRDFDDSAVALEIEWNNKDPFYDRDLDNFKRLHVEGAISAGVIITRGESFQSKIAERIAAYAHQRDVTKVDDLQLLGLSPTTRQLKAYAAELPTGVSFPEFFAKRFCADKFGTATTHWRKLEDRIRRRVGHPCPLLLIGIPIDVVTE